MITFVNDDTDSDDDEEEGDNKVMTTAMFWGMTTIMAEIITTRICKSCLQGSTLFPVSFISPAQKERGWWKYCGNKVIQWQYGLLSWLGESPWERNDDFLVPPIQEAISSAAVQFMLH